MLKSSENSPMYESDHNVVENLDDGQLEQLYERGWLPDAEDHLAQMVDFESYTNSGEVGWQQFGFVETRTPKNNVALKIIIADESHEKSSELRLVDRESLDFEEVGGECIAVPREHFWHDGPNGRHLCLVLPVLGPRVSTLWRKFEDPTKVARDISLQVTRGLHFLHKNGICHGDFRPSNILFKLTGFDELSEDELINQLGEPSKEPLLTISGDSPAPSGPEYLVEGLNLDRLNAQFISDQVSVIDFGESYDMHLPPEDLGITASFRSPELLFDNTTGVGCDLWALACTIYEIRTRSPLFENFMDNDDEVIMQMVPLLGKLPEPWWSSWKARGQWYKEDGSPLINQETGKPYMLMDSLEMLLSGSSSFGDNPEGKKNAAGGFIVQKEESEVLGNLLRDLLRYNPKERPNFKAVLEHSWFKR